MAGPGGALCYVHPALPGDQYFPDAALRCFIPGRWLAAHGIQVAFATYATIEDLDQIFAATAGWTHAVRLAWAVPKLAEAFIGRRFTLLPEMPVRHMTSGGRPVPPDRRAQQVVAESILVREAEALIVYSQPVADAFVAEGARGPVHVVPDALGGLAPMVAHPDPCRLVWGVLSHPYQSLDLIAPALERVLATRPRVRVGLFNGATDWMREHAQVDVLTPPITHLPFAQYLERFLGLRPGIVLHPLGGPNELRGMSTALNAAAAGAALLVSPRGLYPTHFRDGEECLFVEDGDANWEAAITRVLDEPGLRDHLAAGLRRWVTTHALIDVTGPLWAAALGIELPTGQAPRRTPELTGMR